MCYAYVSFIPMCISKTVFLHMKHLLEPLEGRHINLKLVSDVSETISVCIIRGWCHECCVYKLHPSPDIVVNSGQNQIDGSVLPQHGWCAVIWIHVASYWTDTPYSRLYCSLLLWMFQIMYLLRTHSLSLALQTGNGRRMGLGPAL